MPRLTSNSTLILFIVTFLFSPFIQSEVFTATDDIEKLIYSEYKLYHELDNYIKLQQNRLVTLRKLLDEIKSQMHGVHLKGYEQGKHPLAVFLLVRRFLRNWKELEATAEEEQIFNDKLLDTFAYYKRTFPNLQDLEGSAEAILRLQDVYNLKEIDLASGIIDGGPRLGVQLSWLDCFTIGKKAYENEDFERSYKWMKIVQRSQNPSISSDQWVKILDYLAFSAYKLGNVKEAMNLTQALLKLDPKHERAKQNIYYYEKVLTKNSDGKEGEDSLSQDENDWSHEFDFYKKLCRGGPKAKAGDNKMVSNHLTCYQLRQHARLLFSPINVEVISLQPYILIYHNLLNDLEVEALKTLAAPMLQRATVHNKDTGKLEYATYRISKSAWLNDDDHPLVRRISTLIEDVTGLTMESAEALQIANYGIGGHYEPHFDHADSGTDVFKTWKGGNRIATMLIYLSSVELGGATVFSSAGVRIEPRQGSAAFWYNLHRNGNGNNLTRHAACPVLIGSKWIANKWIHQVGQELRHQCTLNSND
ncbi:Prolyl 4-hydroxylase subunit alpha-2 [Trichoplax sp. H2]|nr:Prolyl 4-hydroxylase subunit alpha-2 [Trichoplax sp. H2]|eukprot:RDD40049.1 Prolyl 4-hydroxylase subunit alpha-2 [Trichoplax sp. H2]